MIGRDMITRMLSGYWVAYDGLDRYRRMWIVMQSLLFVIACMFWIDSMTVKQGFARETWGDFAYSLPASMWAAVQMSSSSMIIIGLLRPIRGWMVSVGSFVLCLNYVGISYSAVFTGGVVVVGLHASLFFLPLHMWLLVEAISRAHRTD